MNKNNTLSRRSFVKSFAYVMLGSWVASLTGFTKWLLPTAWANKWAGFDAPPPCSEAKTLTPGTDYQSANKVRWYVHDASKYASQSFTNKAGKVKKAKKIKKLLVGSNCTNCSFYSEDKTVKSWGKCSVLGGKCAYKKGLCAQYGPKKEFKETAKKA